MVVIILGSLGAFGTMSMASTSNVLAEQRGYKYVNSSQPCVADIMCSTTNGDICQTTTFVRLWGKEDAEDVDCTIPLYKK